MASARTVHELLDCFRKIVQALRSSHRAAGQLQLTGAQLYVLKVIADADAPLTVGEVAERTMTDQSTVSVVARRLVERGLLERGRSDEDSRRVYLRLTAKGRAINRRAPTTTANRRLAEALERLSPADAAKLQQTLERLVREMGADRAKARLLFDEE